MCPGCITGGWAAVVLCSVRAADTQPGFIQPGLRTGRRAAAIGRGGEKEARGGGVALWKKKGGKKS